MKLTKTKLINLIKEEMGELDMLPPIDKKLERSMFTLLKTTFGKDFEIIKSGGGGVREVIHYQYIMTFKGIDSGTITRRRGQDNGIAISHIYGGDSEPIWVIMGDWPESQRIDIPASREALDNGEFLAAVEHVSEQLKDLETHELSQDAYEDEEDQVPSAAPIR